MAEDQELGGRVSALETGLTTLVRNVDSLADTIREVAVEQRRGHQLVQDELKSSHDRLSRDITQQGRVNYPLIAALLTIMGLALTLMTGFGAFAYTVIHDDIDNLGDNLRVEMRLLDAAGKVAE